DDYFMIFPPKLVLMNRTDNAQRFIQPVGGADNQTVAMVMNRLAAGFKLDAVRVEKCQCNVFKRGVAQMGGPFAPARRRMGNAFVQCVAAAPRVEYQLLRFGERCRQLVLVTVRYGNLSMCHGNRYGAQTLVRIYVEGCTQHPCG